jgi:hypothetical protein
MSTIEASSERTDGRTDGDLCSFITLQIVCQHFCEMYANSLCHWFCCRMILSFRHILCYKHSKYAKGLLKVLSCSKIHKKPLSSVLK